MVLTGNPDYFLSQSDTSRFDSERRARAESRALAEWWDYISLFRPLAIWLARSCRPKCTRARSPTSLRS